MAEGRAMMGSKNDMIGSKFDEVSRNQIWREFLRKEARLPPKTCKFVINPKTVKPLAPKPGQREPEAKDDDPDFVSLKTTLRKAQEVPTDKFDFPATASQEIGWYWKDNVREKYMHARTKCTETKYAESYYAMAGTSPYAKRREGGAARLHGGGCEVGRRRRREARHACAFVRACVAGRRGIAAATTTPHLREAAG
eukprot:CAMPEP_0203807772 /NCGR_PEP_ID=MMETSP0115-20131106/1245_1 /ASSEMBLY_ACC=CAM_ASM_000227 /TAXON_ID=33651 /ORGANISM="Bicosoecid sp, Strain ms1" /LENGTH=195 /DNA_ID=CAMNT_0050716457 /DNA_START=25 /DNA_END=609 /DNA_ORIENTATION=+